MEEHLNLIAEIDGLIRQRLPGSIQIMVDWPTLEAVRAALAAHLAEDSLRSQSKPDNAATFDPMPYPLPRPAPPEPTVSATTYCVPAAATDAQTEYAPWMAEQKGRVYIEAAPAAATDEALNMEIGYYRDNAPPETLAGKRKQMWKMPIRKSYSNGKSVNGVLPETAGD